MPITINGDGSITGLSVGGLPDGCVDTDTIANSAVTSTKTTLTSGITVYDKWVGSSTQTGNQNPFTAWVRHNYTSPLIGTGMSHSSGTFTFPQTGIYLVRFNADMYNTSNYERTIDCDIMYTTNNGSYNLLQNSSGNVHNIGSYNIHTTVQVQGMLDVTDTSNVKVQFKITAYNNASTLKAQGYNANGGYTYVDFTRVADT